MVVLVMAWLMAEGAAAQAQIGPCLITCAQKAITCYVTCGGSGVGVLACYQGCSSQNTVCNLSCFTTPLIKP